MNPRAGAGRCWDVGHFRESDVGTIKQVVGHGASDDGEARDELAQPPLPAPRPPPALLRRCLCSGERGLVRSPDDGVLPGALSAAVLLEMRRGVKSLAFGKLALML